MIVMGNEGFQVGMDHQARRESSDRINSFGADLDVGQARGKRAVSLYIHIQARKISGNRVGKWAFRDSCQCKH